MAAPTFFERYADRIEYCPMSGCWLWSGADCPSGYGKFRLAGVSRYAHRAAYEEVNGAGSADGLVVRHSCDTPPCMNPAHLLGGTHRDNAQDRMARGRQGNPGPRLGESPNRKLLVEQVAAIKGLLRDTKRSGASIARDFDVSTSTVSLIRKGRIWPHVEPHLTKEIAA